MDSLLATIYAAAAAPDARVNAPRIESDTGEDVALELLNETAASMSVLFHATTALPSGAGLIDLSNFTVSRLIFYPVRDNNTYKIQSQ